MRAPDRRIAGTAAALGLSLLTACSSIEGTPVTAPSSRADGAAACASVDDPLVALNAQPGEPTVELPTPAGWERHTAMDSEIIRLGLVNTGFTRDRFTPNVVATAETSTGDPQAAFELQLTGLRRVYGDSVPATGTPGTVCGYPSWTLDYTLPAQGSIPARPAILQVIVVPRDDSASTTYTMTAQATAPADPQYEADVRAMFEGVQISGAQGA